MRTFLQRKINCPQLRSRQFRQVCFSLLTKVCKEKETDAERIRFAGQTRGPATESCVCRAVLVLKTTRHLLSAETEGVVCTPNVPLFLGENKKKT